MPGKAGETPTPVDCDDYRRARLQLSSHSTIKLSTEKCQTRSSQIFRDLTRLPLQRNRICGITNPFWYDHGAARQNRFRVHASSGTTGKSHCWTVQRTRYRNLAGTMARVYAAAGVTAKDSVAQRLWLRAIHGGLGFHLGAERIGATSCRFRRSNHADRLHLWKVSEPPC